ncbi:GAF and ANTAR domain-containing protein [Cellulosimicrobium sp. PMB13]|uniref:ANTAR domain-containing protein n=1 Tax=Cellulosimicrobium sp. PMB13 TaxID=3120158 RepID=UPI003F4C1C59
MSISRYPSEFAQRAAAVLGSDLEVSITLREHGLSLRAGSSTAAAARCDQAEALADSGPCIDAIGSRTAVLVPAIAADDRWEAWRDQAVREGFVSSLGVPALVGPDVGVALNLYSRKPDPWDDRLLAAADSYAQLVASAVRLHLELAELEDRTAGLYREMSDVVAVERAVGAIMHTNGCSEAEARRILESASQHRNVSGREVAETVLRALVVSDDDPVHGS